MKIRATVTVQGLVQGVAFRHTRCSRPCGTG